ncbi:MAG: hypothetical protein ACI4JF_03200 [Oscillospiraceae bacterium]
MNKKSKYILACCMVLLTACNSAAPAETSETASDTTSAAVTGETEQTSAVLTDAPPEESREPAVFSIYLANSEEDMPFDDNIAEKIKEITGVTLEITRPEGDYADEISEMIASDALPDMIYAADSTDEVISSGYAALLDGYFETGGNNIKAMYGAGFDKLRAEDGHIYTVGTVSEPNTDIYGTFQIQLDVLKEAGYPEITTLEELEDCLAAYAENHKWINERSTVGFSFCGGTKTNRGIFEDKINALLGLPYGGDFIYDGETAVYKWLHPQVKEFYRWLNRLYNKGLLDEKTFTQGHTTYEDKLASGCVLAIADIGENIAAANEQLPESRQYFPLAVTIDENTLCPELYNYGYSGESGIMITTSCRDPQRAFEFLDDFCSDEVQTLIGWGIEGEDYTVSDGVRTLPESDEENISSIGLYRFPFPVRSSLDRDPSGNYYSPDYLYADRSGAETEALEAYGILTAAELFPRDIPAPRPMVGADELSDNIEAEIIRSTLETYVSTETANAVMCPEEEFDERWDDIMAWLTDNGVDRLNDIVNDMI